jgi:hypothetical protein
MKPKGLGRGLEAEGLGTDHGVVKGNGVIDPEPIVRLHRNTFSILLEDHGPDDPCDPARTVQGAYAGGIDQIYIDRGATVENRDLLAVHLDNDVVHLKARKGRQEVFHRGDLGPLGTDGRRQARPDDAVRLRDDVLPPGRGEQGEYNARIGGSRLEHHLDLLAAMQPHAGASDFFFEGRLFHSKRLTNCMPPRSN